jgi:hypothetical protein
MMRQPWTNDPIAARVRKIFYTPFTIGEVVVVRQTNLPPEACPLGVIEVITDQFDEGDHYQGEHYLVFGVRYFRRWHPVACRPECNEPRLICPPVWGRDEKPWICREHGRVVREERMVKLTSQEFERRRRRECPKETPDAEPRSPQCPEAIRGHHDRVDDVPPGERRPEQLLPRLPPADAEPERAGGCDRPILEADDAAAMGLSANRRSCSRRSPYRRRPRVQDGEHGALE